MYGGRCDFGIFIVRFGINVFFFFNENVKKGGIGCDYV